MRNENESQRDMTDPDMPPEFGWNWTGQEHVRVRLAAVPAGDGAPRDMVWAAMLDRPHAGSGPGAWIAHQCIEQLWDAGDPSVDRLRWLRARIMAAGARALYVKTGMVGCELAQDIDGVWDESWNGLKLGPPPDTIPWAISHAAYHETRTVFTVAAWALAALEGSEAAHGSWTAAPNVDAVTCLKPQEFQVTQWAMYGAHRAFEVWCGRLGGKWRKGDYNDLLRDVGRCVNRWLQEAHPGNTATLLLHAYTHKGCVDVVPDTPTATEVEEP